MQTIKRRTRTTLKEITKEILKETKVNEVNEVNEEIKELKEFKQIYVEKISPKSKRKINKKNKKQNEIIEEENINNENIIPSKQLQFNKESLSQKVIEKKGKGKSKKGLVLSEQQTNTTHINTQITSSSSSIITPSTPEKQKVELKEPTLSPTEKLAKMNLFGTEKEFEKLDLKDKVTTTTGTTSSSFSSNATFSINPAVKKSYKLIQKATGALGGNGYTGAIYGELTMHSMQKVINYMIENCELTSSSRFIDVGSGLGKPNVHAAQDPCCRISIGIELEEIRWQLAMQNLRVLVNEMSEDAHLNLDMECDEKDIKLVTGVNFLQGDIFDVATTDPFTHIYMYDLGFPPPLQQKIAEYFNNSTHARYLVSYRPPRRVINEYGYAVKELGKINTSMTGSGENHTAYFYQRINRPAPCVARPNTTLLTIPARPSPDSQEDEVVVCSNKFLNCIELAIGSVESLQAYVNDVNASVLEAGRPKRERKPRIFLDTR